MLSSYGGQGRDPQTISRCLCVGILPENLGLRANISTRSSDKHVNMLLKNLKYCFCHLTEHICLLGTIIEKDARKVRHTSAQEMSSGEFTRCMYTMTRKDVYNRHPHLLKSSMADDPNQECSHHFHTRYFDLHRRILNKIIRSVQSYLRGWISENSFQNINTSIYIQIHTIWTYTNQSVEATIYIYQMENEENRNILNKSHYDYCFFFEIY